VPGQSVQVDVKDLKLAGRRFYQFKTMSAEERLWWYSRFFDVVEVNSSFYAIPSVSTTQGLGRARSAYFPNLRCRC
jgi:uncharacterized protein YecE (DUF72 family)